MRVFIELVCFQGLKSILKYLQGAFTFQYTLDKENNLNLNSLSKGREMQTQFIVVRHNPCLRPLFLNRN